MIIYEVNLLVDGEIAEAYAAWLGPHIGELLALDGFLSADWFEVETETSDGRMHWCVQYRVRDRASLQAYFADHAERLRGDGLSHFDGHFSATRRVLHRQAVFDPRP